MSIAFELHAIRFDAITNMPLSTAALIVVSLAGPCAIGFGLAFYMSLLAMDASEIEELKEQGRFVANNWTPPSLIVRHWRTRPQVKRMLFLAIGFGSMVALTLWVDSHFRA